jgi:hypothetical protein
MRIGMIEMDGARGDGAARLLSPWFTIAAVEAASERIAQISHWLIDTLIDARRMRCRRGSRQADADAADPRCAWAAARSHWPDYGRVLHEAVAKASGSIDGLRWLAGDLRRSVEERDYDPDGLIAALCPARSTARRSAPGWSANWR